MAVNAARLVLEKKKISSDELDLIIVATITPDMMFPSTAALVQNELFASNCWAFDLNASCSGFLYALSVASQFIETGRHKKIIVIGADKMSSVINYNDRNTSVIFGDGAGAVLLEPSLDDELGVEDFLMHTDGSGAPFLQMPGGGSLNPATHDTLEKGFHFLHQDGKTVFKNAVTKMAEISLVLLKRNNLTVADLKTFIPHQANRRIIDALADKMTFSRDKIIVNIENYGNTTAASIPIAMSEAYENKIIKRGDWVLMSAFGAGFTAGSLLLKWAFD
jgi:3-oxoacyl-[acyl-carrier-protein] synthase-3